MFDMDIGIDLGTANVLVYVKGKGIVINQPSVVAFEKKTKKLIALGNKAKLMMGKEPANIEVIRPLKQGVISDFTVTERMLKAFIETAMQKKKMLSRPRVCVCVPSGITEVEKRAVEDSVYHTGAKHVDIMEEPIAAAIGADIDIAMPRGNMIVDIGGGTSDVAVISLGGIVESNSLKLAGDDYNEAMIKYIRRTYNLLIGEPTAEKIKMTVGSVYPREEPVTMEVKGRDLVTGFPARIIVSSEETIEAFAEVTAQILDTIHNVLEISPPELIADIAEHGIVLTGGGSLIYGMDKLVEESTGIHALVSPAALEAVVVGAGKSVNYLNK
ncbi:MAG: rod shape-determining protein [Bacteroidales bacterium]|nr:rod shape-determining protein [Clostridium sp.]MCM1203979.1 rod shape-determining protein [Bacteroidales bacterium]